MTATRPNAGRYDGTLQGHHVLAMLLGFFGAVFAANGFFLFSALSTHTGVVAVEPYRKGLAYNARIAAGQRQNELGWAETVNITPGGKVSVVLAGSASVALPALDIVGSIGRPSTASNDRALRFVEMEPGAYVADAGALDGGAWIVSIEARAAGSVNDALYRARRRLWLKP